jgi:hypothetical protein
MHSCYRAEFVGYIKSLERRLRSLHEARSELTGSLAEAVECTRLIQKQLEESRRSLAEMADPPAWDQAGDA